MWLKRSIQGEERLNTNLSPGFKGTLLWRMGRRVPMKDSLVGRPSSPSSVPKYKLTSMPQTMNVRNGS